MWRYRLCAACSLVVFLFVDVAFSITNTESSKPAAVPAAVPASASAPATNHDTEAAEYTEVSQFQPFAQQLTRGAGGGTLSPLQQTQILSDVQQHRFQLQQTQLQAQSQAQPQIQPQQRTINFQSPAQVPFNRPLYPTQPQFTHPTIGAVAQNYLNNPQLVAQIRHQLQVQQQQQQQQRPLPQYPTPQLPSTAQQHVRTNYQPQQLPPVYRSQVPNTYQQQPLPPSKFNFQQPPLQQQPSRPPIGSNIVATQPTQTAQNPIPDRFNPTVPLTQQTFLPTVAHPAPASTQYTIETPQQTTYARPQQTVVQPSPEYNIELAPKRKPVKSTTTTTTTETPATTTKHIPYRLRYRTTTESPEVKTTTQQDTEFYVKQDNQKLLQQLIEAQQQQVAVNRPEKSTTANQVPQIEIQDELQKHIQQQLQSDGIFQQFKGAVPASPDQLAALPNLDFLAGNDSTPSVVLPNGQKVKIIQVPSSLVSGGSKAAKSSPQIKTIYLNQPTSPPAPTTTVRPPKLVFEELSKDFLPPGADFQVIRQRQDGDLEDIGSTIPQNLPQKKVTFVILEEQPDGTVKVQGVRGNANTEEVRQPLEVDSIIKKLEEGEIKLPPSTKLAPSQRTRSPLIPTNVTPQESVESPAYIKHSGKVPGKHSVFEPTPVSRVPPNYAVESSTKYNQPSYSPSYDAEPTIKYSQPSYTQNYNIESTTKYSQPSYTQNYNVETTTKYSQPTLNHRYNVETSTKYNQPFNRQSYSSDTSSNNKYSRPAQSNVYKTETTTVKHNRQVYNVESSTPFSHTVITPDSESTTTVRYSLPPFTLRAKETYYPTTPAPKLQQYVPIVRNSPTKISYTSANVANSHAGPTFPLNDFTSAGKQRDSSDLYSSKIHTNDNHLNVISPNVISSSERPAEEVVPSLVPTATVQYNVEDPSVSTNTLLPIHGISSTAAPPPFITSSTMPNYVTETSSTAYVQPSVGSSYQPDYSSQNQNTYQQPNHVYNQQSQFQQFTTTESAPLDIGIRTTPSPVGVNPLSLNSVLRREGLYAMAKFLRQSGLDSILNTTGPYTLFVPTDRAFRALLVQLGGPDKAEEKFQENPRLLSGLLLHHVIPGAFQAEALQDEMTGVSLAGTQLRVNTYTTQDEEWNDVKVLTINGAQVLKDKKDIVVPQGIAHAIDRVMFPLPVGDILQTLQSDREGKFNRFLKVVQDSGVASMITGGRTYTIFAPMNHAFKAADVKRFEENRALARNFVLRHLMPGTLYSDGMLYYQLKESLDKNKQLAIFKEAGRIKVNEANVIARNIPATNGVVHAIDNLL